MPAGRAVCGEQRPRAEAFTVTLVTGLLKTAGAPEPWSAPQRVGELVEIFVTAAELSAGMPDPCGQISRMRRAQKAVDELRRVLPGLIQFHLLTGINQPIGATGPASAAVHLQRAANLKLMQDALMDVEGEFSSRRLEKVFYGWPCAAALLFIGYRAVIGSGSRSKNGPAIRFVRAALDQCGYGKRSSGAIESALAAHPVTENL